MADNSFRHAELQFRSGEDTLFPVQFSVLERISTPFEVHVVARSPKFDLALKDIVGYGAALRATGVSESIWTGVCKTIEQVHPEPTEGAVSTYYLCIVPNVWLLSQRHNHRIFQHQTAVEIAEQLLKEWQIEYTNNLQGTYPKLEYRVQYGETDLAFFSRLLEEAGIAYHFKSEGGGGTVKSKLVLADSRFDDAGGHPYADNPNPEARIPYLTKIHVGLSTRPGRFTVRDFDFRRPEHNLLGEAPKASDIEGSWEQYHYSPGGFLIDTGPAGGTPQDDKSTARHDDAEGKSLATRRLEAERFKRRFVEFESNILELEPGMKFSAEGHPRDDVKDKKLLIVESEVHGNATGEFTLVGVAVFADDPFRVPLSTPRPRIDGVQTAIVVGPKDKEIYTDEFGRVRVHFHWDREGPYDDTRTAWIRVSNGWAGPGYGAMTLPRVGHEVLVEFLDGDPDQPVIVGRLYNQVSPFPYKLPDSKTQSTWKTQTSPYEDGSFNEVMFDDQAGKELVFVQGQRNMMKLVKRHETRRVGTERIDVVGENRLSVVARVDAFHTGEQHLVQMIKEKDLKILKMEDPKYSPKKTFIEVRDKKISLTTGDASVVLDGSSIEIQASGGIRFSAAQELIMKGSAIFLNCNMASPMSPSAQKDVDDKVRRPEGRTATAILKLLQDKKEAETSQKRTWGFKKGKVTLHERHIAAMPGNTPAQRAAREKVVREFYDGKPGLGAARAEQDMGMYGSPPKANAHPKGYGIDISKPVKVVSFPPPPTMDQRVRPYDPATGRGGYPGNYFDPLGGQSADAVGLNGDPKLRKTATFNTPKGEGLQSTAGPVWDDWTDRNVAVKTQGGGQQLTVDNDTKAKFTCAKCGKNQCTCP